MTLRIRQPDPGCPDGWDSHWEVNGSLQLRPKVQLEPIVAVLHPARVPGAQGNREKSMESVACPPSGANAVLASCAMHVRTQCRSHACTLQYGSSYTYPTELQSCNVSPLLHKVAAVCLEVPFPLGNCCVDNFTWIPRVLRLQKHTELCRRRVTFGVGLYLSTFIAFAADKLLNRDSMWAERLGLHFVTTESLYQYDSSAKGHFPCTTHKST